MHLREYSGISFKTSITYYTRSSFMETKISVRDFSRSFFSNISGSSFRSSTSSFLKDSFRKSLRCSSRYSFFSSCRDSRYNSFRIYSVYSEISQRIPSGNFPEVASGIEVTSGIFAGSCASIPPGVTSEISQVYISKISSHFPSEIL